MSKYVLALPLIYFISTSIVFAQKEDGSSYRDNNYFDLAFSGASGKFSGALSWSHLHGIARKKQRLKIGYGLRFTTFVAANKFYTTAPAKYTSTTQSIGTIFSKTIDENIDTITTTTAATNSMNLAIYIQYRLAKRFSVGLNIDAIGFSFGKEKAFNIISSTFDPNQAPVQNGSPTRFNLLLTSDNDLGSLNSEFYAQYWIGQKIGVRLGYTFLFCEYRTNQKLSFNERSIVNDRYRHKAGMPLIAVTFNPFPKN